MLKSLAGQLPPSEIGHILTRMEQAAFAAAQHMLQAFHTRRSLGAKRKEDSTVVTILDVESQEIIREILGTDVAVIAEEDPATHALITKDEFFLIDPLDGTSACKRFPGFEGGQVGYGPLIGYSRGRTLAASVYVNLPTRTLYSAIRGAGAFQVPLNDWALHASLNSRPRINPPELRVMSESAALFYPGLNGEIAALEKIRTRLDLETTYRFGGFANDCVRLASGYEQIGIQFSLRAWDLSAALIPAEAGLRVVMDPLGSKVDLADFQLTTKCAVLISQPQLSEEVLRALR